MKRINLGLLLVVTSLGFAESYTSIVLQNPSKDTRVAPNALVMLCSTPDLNVPCTTTATTYIDQTLTHTCTLNKSPNGAPTSGTGCNNPGLTDSNGSFTVFMAPGNYRLCTYAQNYVCKSISSSEMNDSTLLAATNFWTGQNNKLDGTQNISITNPSQGSGNFFFWNGWTATYFSPEPVAGTNFVMWNALQNAYDGGHNVFGRTGSYYDKTNWQPFQFAQNTYTPGQHDLVGFVTNNYSIGDTLPLSVASTCAGGENAGGDEGCEAADLEVLQSKVEFTAMVVGGASNGSTLLRLTPTGGAGTQGSERFLIDTTTGTISTGAISNISGVGPVTYTGSETDWPISNVNTTLGTPVTISDPNTPPITVEVKPASMTNITRSSLLCIADEQNFEMVIPSATTSSTFTATFYRPHPSSAIVASGGLCGYGIEIVADRSLQENTLHWVWPVVSSSSSTSLKVWISEQGAYQSYRGRWSASAKTYVLYPMAIVKSVQTGGALSNTFALYPNNVAWTNSDAVVLPHYPAIHVQIGQFNMNKYFPSLIGGGGPNITLNGLWSAPDVGLNVVNGTPNSTYRSRFGGAGTLLPPNGLELQGTWNNAIQIDSRAGTLIGYGDATPSVAQDLITVLSNNGSATSPLGYVRAATNAGFNRDYSIFGHGLTVCNDGEMASGTIDPCGRNTAMYFYYDNANWAGFSIQEAASSPTQPLLGAYVQGVPRFELSNTQAFFNEGVSLTAYRDNQSTPEWSLNSSNGNATLAGHLNQAASGNWAGTCTMSSSTTCTISLAAAFSSTPGCVVTVQSSTVIAGGCTVFGTTVTVTAARPNSLTWAAILFGNPN